MSSLLPEHWPGDWQARPAWDVLASRDEFGGQGPQLSLSVARGVRPREVGEGRAASENTEHYRVVRSGDLVINRLVARDGAISISKLDGLISPAYWVLRPRWSHNDARFIAYQLRSSPYLAEIGRISKDMPPAQFDLPWDQFRRLPIALPREDQQRAIADYLDIETARIDALIEKKHRLALKVEDRWLRELLFDLGLASTQSSVSHAWIAPSLPDGWSVKPLRRLLDVAWGGDWGSEPGDLLRDLPCVRAADFDFANLAAMRGASRSFDKNTLRSRLLKAGDLVIEKSGGGDGVPVGRVVAWKGEGQAVPTNFAGGLRPAAGADPVFVLLAFRAAYEIGLPWRSIKQTTGLQNLDINHYLSHAWPVPPLEVQRSLSARLMARLARMRGLQQRLTRQVELVREHRQALITAAVTGELEVPGVAA